MPDWVPAHRRVIGDRIRDRRRELQLSQAGLGERVGRDHKTIHRWETAGTNMTVTDLLLLARALHTTVGTLADEE
ncbi:helix-turn-helix transcriptional regulator [Streptomyces sp. ST1015]|uniref:helix-turn-helix transcriptional regulator n=1 Tax=Streptomyces sp. ST1015 TaxID=1848900 RepID=UPI000DDC1888|nr:MULTISPECIES: helix-turn-helix transcriptional regulator [unclassified Streptomyces]QZZ26498.1 helix-turn-helix transcriptional regulator [Streptomyces sp. ST1015]